jgi:benzoyl-CoA reductase/2-hydroxyglutaryl-CoA dehydratase subunit BcrC/BadD/HgdB
LEAIDKLEEITGKKFDYDKFHEIMNISRETSIWWKKASLTARAKPSPLDGFELFNYMATLVCMRGTKEGRDLYKLWYEELTDKASKGLGPWKANKETGIIPEEKYRVMWDGIACWPYLGVTYKTLKKYGINMVTSTYPDSWYIVYETGDLDGMAKCYSSNYVNRSLDFGINNVVNIVNDFSLDGIVFHSNRSCKLMDFRQFEVQRQVEARTGVPSIIFDGDQTDPRAFNEAQFETRVQALVEMMEARKGK